MTTTRKRPSSSAAIRKDLVEQATSALQDLPDKPKDVLTLGEAVVLLEETITVALKKGYSLEEIAKLLSLQGIEIRPESLKYYLAATRRQRKAAVSQPKVRRIKPTSRKTAKNSPSSRTAASALKLDATAPSDLSSTSGAEASNGAVADTTPLTRRRSTGTSERKAKPAAAKSKSTTTRSSRTQSTTAAKTEPATTSRSTRTASKAAPKSTPSRRRKKSDTPE